MKKFLMMAALLVATLTVSAQDYNWAIGVRGGGFSGLTVKKNNGGTALEFGASWNWNNNLCVDGVYLWQTPVIADGFSLYYGAGPYLGLWDTVDGSAFALGAEGVVGLEYKIPSVPIAFSLDYRPGINVLPNVAGNLVNFGLGVKFCF